MSDNHTDNHHHAISLEDNIAVFVCLLCLTLVTVIVATFDMGMFNLPVALLVATVKASLVFLYFMHLRFDTFINRFIFVSGFFFVALLYIICALDIFYR